MAELSLLSKGLSRAPGDRQARLANNNIICPLLRIGYFVFAVLLSLGYAQAAWCGDNKVHFQIPPSSADRALNLFALQADIQLLYPFDLIEDLRLKGLTGTYTVDEGIKRLITGTCLEVDVSTKNNVILSANTRGFWFMKNKNCQKSGVLSAVSAAIIAGISGANAQDAPAPERSTVIEEVIVTAQKRAQSVQDVPITISAVTGDQLAAMGIEGTDQLATVVPGLQFDRRSNAGIIRLRGIGNPATTVGQEPSVAVYVDGVYNPSVISTMMNFNNVERVEVLKGPQGTLFGRNATGGVIQVITRDPSHEPALDISLGAANFDTVESKLYGSIGLSDTVATDLSVYYKDQSEGYIDNITLGKDVGYEESFAVRNKWLIDIGDDTRLTLIGSHSETETDLGMIKHPREGTLAVGGTPHLGFYKSTENWDQYSEQEFTSFSLRVDHDLESLSLVSISAYQDEAMDFPIDQDGTPVPLVNAVISQNAETLSQEFQLLSNNDSDFQWVLGTFLYRSTQDHDPLSIGGAAAGAAQQVNIWVESEATSVAVFADGHYQLTDNTGLTLGARYTRDEIQLSGQTFFAAFPASVQPPAYEREFDSKEPTWRAGFDHNISDDFMVFGMYSRGYKTGVYNTVITSGVPGLPVEPEVLDSFELGFKSTLLDGIFQLNGALFQNEIQDLQVFVNVPGGIQLTNAAEATIRGLELDGTLMASDQLTLTFGLSLMDSEYDEFKNAQLFPALPAGGNNPNVLGDLSGNDVAQTPDMTANLGIRYFIPVSFGELSASLNYYHNDGFYWEPTNNIEESYDLVNGELGWKNPGQRFGVSLWSRNLLDEEYAINGPSSGFGDLYSPAMPRQYGITFHYSL